MAGNGRFDLASGSPESGSMGNRPNGQRGNYHDPSFDRSGSFRESGESRVFGTGAGTSRPSGTMMGNLPPLSQCLMLEPFVMGDQKYTRSGELRRVLGFSLGSALEENSFGAAHCRPSPSVAVEELKRYKDSILDSNHKARGRAKKLDDNLHKLNKYVDSVNPKKQQRSELSVNERSGGSNLKMGTQFHRNPPDLVALRVEDRSKNAASNKRVRTSVAETRVECRSNGLARQTLVTVKDRVMLKDDSPCSDLMEEKIRRLPVGGEGWEKKMKRKRSLGTAVTRPVDSDGELRRPMHHKFSNESGLHSCDANGLRLGSANGISGTNKLDSSCSPASSCGRAAPKHEQEKITPARDLTAGLNKEKLLAKGNNKLSIREDNHTSSSLLTKGKASRAPRSGSVTAANSSHNIPNVSGASEIWEQPSSVTKMHSIVGANNRKRSVSSGSSSPPMAQWIGQRPQKKTRSRRANLVSPVSNHEEMQLSSEGCSPSDFGTGTNSGGINSSIPFRGLASGAQQFKVKLENVSSPARFSESEESFAGETKLKDKAMHSGKVEEKATNAVQNVGPSLLVTKNTITKEEISDAVRRRSSFSMASISPVKEKLGNTATAKPLSSTRPGSDKNGSKTGRPLKKLVDRKGFSRRGHTPNSNSPDINGELDDDREELLAAANLARAASYHACSSTFWKKVETIFASVSSLNLSSFSQEVKFAEELHESLQNEIELKESARMEFTDKLQDFDTLCGKLDPKGKLNEVTPLYQRVLSALILEDDIGELEEDDMGRNETRQCVTSEFRCDAELCSRDVMEFDFKSTFGVRTQKEASGNRFFSCNGGNTSNRSPTVKNWLQNDELSLGQSGFVHSEVGTLAGLSGNDLAGQQVIPKNGFIISSSDSQYETMRTEDKLMLELQSVGIYLDTVPDLDNREDEVFNQETVQLKKGLHQQIGRKKAWLHKMYETIQLGKEAETRELEQVAMDKLVELAYKKLLATRGSIASKCGIPKVSRQVALAFAKRTLGRCRAFADSGISCFNKPALRDAIFAADPQGTEAEPSTRPFHNSAEPDDLHMGRLQAFGNLTHHCHQSDLAFAKNGPISNRGKKKEVLLDDVGVSAALRPTATLASALLGGAKGKRSERERDKDVTSANTVAKAGRQSLTNIRGERKPKTKPKQKVAQLSTTGNGIVAKFTETTHPVCPSATGSGGFVRNGCNKKNEKAFMLPRTNPDDLCNETWEAMDLTHLPLPDFDSMEELGVGTDLGGADIGSWLASSDDLQEDHDFGCGLAVPTDDIAGLPML